jgi:anti-sigma B factor antagonist
MNEPVLLDEQPAEPLRISVEQPRSDAVVLRLVGDLDLLTAPLLRERLWPLVEQPGQTVILEMSGVEFLGSPGLAELAAAHDLASRHDARVALVGGSHAVLRPLEVTGLHLLFPIYQSVGEALDSSAG